MPLFLNLVKFSEQVWHYQFKQAGQAYLSNFLVLSPEFYLVSIRFDSVFDVI